MGHKADAGEGFTPKPQRGDGLEVLEGPQLAGGVPRGVRRWVEEEVGQTGRRVWGWDVWSWDGVR